ncbi:matrin 3-like 1.1 [Garra rufa]|uniref:matrin 3-like 1.1 n=1 Tax=Garra rufa TaxID=137080 RepID=UPI003CCEB940
MSYNHPYRNQPDGYGTSNDKYKDSQRLYQRESTAYSSRAEQTSPSSSEPVLSSVKALSFLHSCGLDAEDLQTLAALPEHLIATDTLPDLLAQIKKKKAASNSSSRSSALQAASSSRSWDDRSHTQLVEYPLDLPARQSYSLPREQLSTWDDRWENAQQTNPSSYTYNSTESNYVVEYNHLKDKEPYFDKSSYAAEPSRQKASAVPQSYTSYSRDVSQSSHLSSRDNSHSSHLSSRDAPGQSSHRSSRDVGQSSYMANRDTSQTSHRPNRDVSLSTHLSSRDIGQSSHLSSRDVGLSNRGVGLPSLLSSRDAGPSSLLSGKSVAPSSISSGRSVALTSLQSSRSVGPPSLLSGRSVAPPSLLSIRDLAPTSHLSSRDVGKSSQHRRMDSGPKVPTRKEASDFHGKMPPVFPYACVLCDITVLSNKDWSAHIKGAQHANSQLSLVEKYPAWDQSIQSARRNVPQSVRPASRTAQKGGGTSSSRNGSSGNKSGVQRSKSQSSSSQNRKKTEATKGKVVCVKFEVDDVNEAYLRKLLGQFGAIVKIIMLPRMAFVNMGTAGQAEDIVKYFYQNPLRIRGQLVIFTLSAAFNFLQTSRVVSFSPLPSGDGIRSELTAIAKRFGAVKNSLFLPSRGYVEMSSAEEADKLVEHYSTNSLKIKGKTISVCSSTEYQTLGTTEVDKEKSPVPSSSSSRRRRRSCSPRRRSHRDSPSPKRRASVEGSRSRRSQDSKKRDESRHSREKTKESSRRDSSSKSRSKKSSPSKDQKTKTTAEESARETAEDDNDQSDNMADDSDLEGVAVIADDGEALNSEDEFTVDEDMDDDPEEQDASEDVQDVKESDDQTKPSDMDTSSIQPEMSECAATATASDKATDCKEAKEHQQGEKKEPQDKSKELKEEPKELKEELKELQPGKQKEIKEEQKELQQGEQKEPEKKQNVLQEDQKEFKQQEQKELQQEEQKDDTVAMEEEAADSSVNLDKEEGDQMEISTSIAEDKFGKVLEVAGFPVAKKYSEADLMKIGTKYGEVTGCCLVRSNRKVEKALIEMVNAADAAKLEAECKRQHIKLGGRNLRITVSKMYSQLNEGQSTDTDSEKEKVKEDVEETNKEPSSILASTEESTVVMAETQISEEDAEAQEGKESDKEEAYGRVLQIRNLPMTDEYTDADFLSIAEPYGEVVHHWMFRLHRSGLIEMKNASDAEKVVAAANMNKITVAGKHPKISVSTKHAHLNKCDSSLPPCIELEEEGDESMIQDSVSEQPSVETSAVKESSNDNQDDNSKVDEKKEYAADDQSVTNAENSDVVTETHTPSVLDPVGTEFVRPVVGYFCNLCNAIYSSEEEAKNEHCRTPMHHQKLKANLHRLLTCII